MYIPVVPLTLQKYAVALLKASASPLSLANVLSSHSAAHLRTQASHFGQGLPAPDFPQGQGESLNVGRSSPSSPDVQNMVVEGRRMLGLERFETPEGATVGVKALIEEVNAAM